MDGPSVEGEERGSSGDHAECGLTVLVPDSILATACHKGGEMVLWAALRHWHSALAGLCFASTCITLAARSSAVSRPTWRPLFRETSPARGGQRTALAAPSCRPTCAPYLYQALTVGNCRSLGSASYLVSRMLASHPGGPVAPVRKRGGGEPSALGAAFESVRAGRVRVVPVLHWEACGLCIAPGGGRGAGLRCRHVQSLRLRL